MRNNILKVTAILLLTLSVSAMQAQDLRSSYFMERMSFRHRLNPALVNDYGYISFPLLGNFGVSATTNMGLGNFIYPKPGGGTMLFMNKNVNAKDFVSKLRPMNDVHVDLDVALLSFGFFAFEGYNTFDLSLKSQNSFFVPRTMFEFLKVGMTNENYEDVYNVSDLSVVTNNFVELALGHAHDINDRLTIGVKGKLLVGLVNAEANIKQMNIRMSQDRWDVTTEAEVLVSSSGMFSLKSDDEHKFEEINEPDFTKIGPGGYGAAIDLGATYNLLDNLTLSMAVTDFGLIRWVDTQRAYTKNTTISFDGFKDISFDDNSSLDNQVDDLTDRLSEMYTLYTDGKSVDRTTFLNTTLTIGAEYGFFDKKISVGLLSTNKFGTPSKSWNELMGVVNLRPLSWFNVAVSGSISQTGGSMGGVLNFCPRGINFFIGGDYLVARLSPQFIPISRGGANVNFGINFPLGRSRSKPVFRDVKIKKADLNLDLSVL